ATCGGAGGRGGGLEKFAARTTHDDHCPPEGCSTFLRRCQRSGFTDLPLGRVSPMLGKARWPKRRRNRRKPRKRKTIARREGESSRECSGHWGSRIHRQSRGPTAGQGRPRGLGLRQS